MWVLAVLTLVLPISVYAQSNTLIGKWEFWSGDVIYFFWESDNIEFKSDGMVFNYDDEESGKYTAIGGERLRVWSDDEDTYDFIYDIKENNMLTITDEDGDTAIFKRVK
jgi:hypothetical protein